MYRFIADFGVISIHALREEGDGMTRIVSWYLFNFYPRPPRGGRLSYILNGTRSGEFLSTPSARRATMFRLLPMDAQKISIHALREEGDMGRGSGRTSG